VPTRTNLGAILAARAESTPDRLAFTYSRDGQPAEERVTYAQLHRRAQALAGQLRDTVATGSRALILLEPGLDFVATVFGCFQAGVIGVTAAPPRPDRLHRTLPRLRTVANDAQLGAVLATTELRDAAKPRFADHEILARVLWITVDENLEPDGSHFVDVGPSDIAFLQYTSGSTTAPRGVMLTHANIQDNVEVLGRGMRISSESRTLSWLPPSHDMGLITGILQPVYFGHPAALMSPQTIIKRPIRWLEGVAGFRATVSGAPNFAYELAVRRTTQKQRDLLDLSCWDVAFNGAEPVLARTLEAFAETFAPSGFRRSSLYPCYGLAESTLMVSGPRTRRDPTLVDVDAVALRTDTIKPARPGVTSVTLVGCGEPGDRYEVAIVDPKSLRRAAPDEPGEIWVAGPSVASGYWHQPDETREVFEAQISGEDTGRRFLRTGDFGFLRAGELFVLGRRKDVVIVRGRNYHAHDIEVSAEVAHPKIRRHCSAAFQAGAHDGGAVAMVLEIEPGAAQEAGAIIKAARQHVVEDLDVQLECVVLVAPGAVPKTTSGKIQRQLCKRLLSAGSLPLLAEWPVDAHRVAIND
jgi:acyl-CoA synthetase (AMP-forming)/AMP-acid ligase II